MKSVEYIAFSRSRIQSKKLASQKQYDNCITKEVRVYLGREETPRLSLVLTGGLGQRPFLTMMSQAYASRVQARKLKGKRRRNRDEERKKKHTTKRTYLYLNLVD